MTRAGEFIKMPVLKILILLSLGLGVAGASGDPGLVLERSVSATRLLSGQTVEVTLTLQNTNPHAKAFELRETVPEGLEVLAEVLTSEAERVDENALVWQGVIEAQETMTFGYRARVMEDTSPTLALQAALSADGASAELEPFALNRLVTTTRGTRADAEEAPEVYAGDDFEVVITVANPLEEDLEFILQTRHNPLLSLLEGPETLRVPALSSAEARFSLHAEREGRAVFAVTPSLGSDALGGEEDILLATGNTGAVSLEVLPEPTLPETTQTTELFYEVSAENVPDVRALALVVALPEGARYLEGSTRINGRPAEDPLHASGALVFDLPAEEVTLAFGVTHEGNLEFVNEEGARVRVETSLLALTPEPGLLRGNPEAVALYGNAVPADPEPEAVERSGTVILEPYEGEVFRTRDRITVRVDMPLGDGVRVFANGEALSEEIVGQQVFDSGLNRQTFDYVGVKLQPGPNLIRLDSQAADGHVTSDERTVFLAGPVAGVEIQPVSDLVAGTALPLVFEIVVRDAWGNIPADGTLTLMIQGARPRTPDASPHQLGYQVRYRDGRVRLEFQPLEVASRVSIGVLVDRRFVTQSFIVRSDLRPWVMSGAASVGGAYGPGGPLRFSVGGSVFGQGAVFDEYLLTVGARYPLNPLGLPAEPYTNFPVLGSSGSVTHAARSRDGVFVRLERDLSHIQYGDFDLPLEGSLLGLPRNYTGLSGSYHLPGLGLEVRGYAALAAVTREVTNLDIPADGTSLYRLPNAPIEPGSLRVSVIKRSVIDGSLLPEEEDPRTGPLQPLLDYTVDARLGVLQLARPLPITDGLGNAYALRVSYRVIALGAARVPQFGTQVVYSFDHGAARAGFYQDNQGPGAFARVFSVGADYGLDGLRGDVELAYGHSQESGGLAFSAGLRYEHDALTAEGRYGYVAEGYRSATVGAGTSAGQSFSVQGGYAVTPELSLNLDTRVSQLLGEAGSSWRYSAEAFAEYVSEDVLGEDVLGEGASWGRRPSAQFGVQVEDSQWRLLAGAGLRDLGGLSGLDASLVHRQGLSALATSLTDFSVSYALLENLRLRLTQRIAWGVGHTLLAGLETGFNHDSLLGALCADCEPASLGDTRVIAQYELTGGVGAEAGRFLLGITSRYPLTENLSIEGSLEQVMGLTDTQENATVLALGGTYTEEDYNANARYELRLAEDTKHVVTAGINLALSEAFYGAVTANYLYDAGQPTSHGLRFSVAGAYRAGGLDLITQHTATLGNYSPNDQGEITGDLRLVLPFGAWTAPLEQEDLGMRHWDARFGYIYRYRFDQGYQDMLTLGASAHPWEGSSVSVIGRLFHDWSSQELVLGAGLELSQRIDCGVHGVVGYNAAGFGESFGGVHTRPGLYVRMDVVFDEDWRCGALGGEVGSR